MIAGIDYSTKAIDIVLLDDEGDRARHYRLPLAGRKQTVHQLAQGARAAMPPRSWWEERGVWLVGVEDPQSAYAHVAKQLGRVAGAVFTRVPADLTVVETTPKEWKRLLCENANAAKPEVRERVLAMRGLGVGLPADAYDAYGVAWAVRALNDTAIRDAA